jgi:aminoglycoside phosphotransferase (APT) family kinase protein
MQGCESSHADLTDRCQRLLVELDLCAPGDTLTLTPLTGGVASDIVMVQCGDHSYCVKFALAQLKVAEVWRAPVHRNRAEYHWLHVASQVVPASVPKLFGQSDREGGFVMEYLAGDQVYLWKTALLQSRRDNGEAAKVGDTLGRIHAASTKPGFDAAPFQNRDDFDALRLEPYLLFTATRHQGLAPKLQGLADRLYASDGVLVHGDVSPKNILFRSGTPVILDAECATMGDPAFDVAFCLNHLILKALHLPQNRERLFTNVLQLWAAYASHVSWEDPADLESRICDLLPALMLARVDGKSPVEYLTETERAIIRAAAVPLIAEPAARLPDLIADLNPFFKGP